MLGVRQHCGMIPGMQDTERSLPKINDVSDDFAELRKNDAIYVDKTAFVHRLVSDRNSNIVFVSRPRRFGKSLTVSLLKNLFAGRRELFKGLAIEQTDWKWLKHPVIHFDFNGMTVETPEKFGMEMTNHVHDRLARAGFTCDTTRSAAENFAQAIETLAEKSRRDAKERPDEFGEGVVILIDEYDAPVGHALADVEKAEKIRDRMSSLYAAMAYGSTEESVHENSYGRCLSFLLASCGFRFRMEDVQASGRADIVADHPALTCIFELKVGEPVDAAFAQLREKGYADPYRASGKPIWLIGLSFDRESRKLVDCTAERLG